MERHKRGRCTGGYPRGRNWVRALKPGVQLDVQKEGTPSRDHLLMLRKRHTNNSERPRLAGNQIACGGGGEARRPSYPRARARGGSRKEALWFYGIGSRPFRFILKVGEARIRVKNSLKYLGLYLDGLWTFRTHFERLAPRLESVAGGLVRLLPNMGGPDHRVRRLYV